MSRERESASSTTYDSELRATEAEIAFVRGLGYHLEIPREDRLRMLMSYLATLDWPNRDWGHVDVERVRFEAEIEIAKETKARAMFVPTNGHGVYGLRQYAQPVGEYRREIRRGDEGEEDQ